MRKFFLLTAVCGAMVLGWGCSDDEEPVKVGSISFDKPTLTLEPGQSEVLTLVVTPSDARYDGVVWQTSAAAVVTVEEGTVTAVADGSATISATAGGKTATCTVTVRTDASEVSLDKKTVSVPVGGTEQLTATVTPAQATDPSVTWSSSDDGIASISQSGLVTGVAKGSAVITVTTNDGGHTATCEVTVVESSRQWSVGEYYEVEGVKGVVVEISNGGMNGKLVSMTENSDCLWASNSVSIGCESETDGKANTQKVKDFNSSLSAFPAFKWCVSQGTGWYMPAVQEAKLLFADLDKVNAALSANGGTPIGSDNYYWSSTEASEGSALCVYFSNGAARSVGDMMDGPDGITGVRAMYAF